MKSRFWPEVTNSSPRQHAQVHARRRNLWILNGHVLSVRRRGQPGSGPATAGNAEMGAKSILLSFSIMFWQLGVLLSFNDNAEQCFRVIYPQHEHVFSFPDEHKSISLLFRVNCPGKIDFSREAESSYLVNIDWYLQGFRKHKNFFTGRPGFRSATRMMSQTTTFSLV